MHNARDEQAAAMYNRYLSSSGTAFPDDRFTQPDPQDAPVQANEPADGKPQPALKLLSTPPAARAEASLLQTGRSLLRSLHIPDLTFDDLLLIAIIFLLLRESDDDDIIIILAALFFTGFFKNPEPLLTT